MTIAILSLCGAIAGFVTAYFVVNNVVLKKKKAQILKEAETEGENIKKEKIFQAKEKFLQLKSAHDHTSTLIEFIGIGCPYGIQTEGIVLCQFQADTGRQITPGFCLCCHIIGDTGT